MGGLLFSELQSQLHKKQSYNRFAGRFEPECGFAWQGVQYDDDEGYEDNLDDGGDEGPTY